MTMAMMFRTSTGTILRRRLGFAVAPAALVLGVASCGGGGGSSTVASAQDNLIHSNPANGKTTITVGSKNFSEEFILAEVYAQALRAAGYKVKTRLDLGSEKVALKAVKDGQVSGYPEYTSTALGSFFHVPSSQIPSNATQAYSEAKADLAREGIVAFPPTPFADSNAVGSLASTARKLGLRDISDLTGKSRNLVLAGSPECRVRMDCLAGLEQSYGLRFKQFKPVAIGRRYAVLDNGEANLSILFTSDAQLASFDQVHDPQRRQGPDPPRQCDLHRVEERRRPGGPGSRRDDREGSGQPDAPGHPGAELPGRYRQAETRPRSPANT